MNIQEVTLNFKNSEGKVTPVTFKVPHGISINPKGTIETAYLLTNLSPEFGDAYLINSSANSHMFSLFVKYSKFVIIKFPFCFLFLLTLTLLYHIFINLSTTTLTSFYYFFT